MAYQEVTIPDEELGGSNAEFFKFNAIGDSLAGLYVKTVASTGTYAKPGQLDYIFYTKRDDGSVAESRFTPPYAAAKMLGKAAADGLLIPGAAVILKWVRNKPIDGREQPMKIFELKVDHKPKLSGPVVPTPRVKPAPDDDAPF